MNSEVKLPLSWSHSKSYIGRRTIREIYKTKLAAYVKIMNSCALGFLTKKTHFRLVVIILSVSYY